MPTELFQSQLSPVEFPLLSIEAPNPKDLTALGSFQKPTSFGISNK